MATIDKLVGKVAPVVKGTWDTATKYEPLDIVSSDGGSYIAKNASAGQKPATTSDYWKPLAVKGDKGDRGEMGIVSPIVTADQPANTSKGTLWLQLTNDKVGDAQRGFVAMRYFSGTDNTFKLVKVVGSTLLAPGTVKTAQLEPASINFSVMDRSSLSIYGNDFLQAINTSGTGKIAGKLIQLDSTVTVKDNLNLRPVLATKILATDIATLVNDTITNMGNWSISDAQALKETNLPIKEQGILEVVPWNNSTSGYLTYTTFTNNGRQSMRYFADVLQGKIGAWVSIADASNVLKAYTASTLNGTVTLNNGGISSLNHPVTKTPIGSTSGANNLWTGTTDFTIRRDSYVQVNFNITKNETPTYQLVAGDGSSMYFRTGISAVGMWGGTFKANLRAIKGAKTETGATVGFSDIFGEMSGYGLKYSSDSHVSLFTPALISTTDTVKAQTVTASGAVNFGTLKRTSALPAVQTLKPYTDGHIDFQPTATGVIISVWSWFRHVKTGETTLNEPIPKSIPAPLVDAKIAYSSGSGIGGVTNNRPYDLVITFQPDGHIKFNLHMNKENPTEDSDSNGYIDLNVNSSIFYPTM